MMLIPTAFIKLPDESGCYNGEVVMGGTVSQLAMGLAQLSHCKFLGEAHYQVSHSTYGPWSTIYETGTRLHNYAQIRSEYKGREYNFLYKSTALSQKVACLFSYAGEQGADNPSVTIEVRSTSSNSYSGTVLDYGCKFLNLDTQGYSFSTDSFAFTGTTLDYEPSNSSPDLIVRPLFVPSANRGELLNIKVTVTDVALSGFHIYDVYEVEVTP
jgi:hypothetical protein